jgi:hypothetical protein
LATISWQRSRQHSTVFTWSERAGIPLAAYRRFFPSKQRFVTMFQCWSKRQEYVVKALNLFQTMDSIIVHCKSMQENLIQLGAPTERVKTIRYSIDQSFFSPPYDVKQVENFIISVGESSSRDYVSLFKAVKGLPITLKVAGHGHWYAREKNYLSDREIP